MGSVGLATVLWAWALTGGTARAQDESEEPLEDEPSFSAPVVAVHGFVSQGIIFTAGNAYLAEESDERPSLEFTELGINFTSQLTDDLRVGVQFFARDLGPMGNYTPRFDWGFLDYRLNDSFGIRAGRIKLPFGLYNDSSDIDAARTPILLPQSVYPVNNRDFLLAQTGLELYGRIDLEGGGAFGYRLYGGTIFLDLSGPLPPELVSFDLSVPYIVGGRVLWEAPLEGLRLGGSVQALRLETEAVFRAIDPMTMMPINVSSTGSLDAVLGVASIEYVAESLTLAAEYSRWHVQCQSADPRFCMDSVPTSERAYALAAYRFTPWLETSVYYSVLFPDTRDREGRAQQQHDLAVTGRFDFNAHWLLKLELHYMYGTAGLSEALNDDVDRTMLDRYWAVFLAKTTAYF